MSALISFNLCKNLRVVQVKVDEAFETVSSPLAAGFVAVNIFL